MYRSIRPYALAILLLTPAASLAAQQRVIHAGPLLGGRVATITGDNQDDATSITTSVVGGFASVTFGRLAVQSELTLARNGTDWPDEDASISIGYLRVPVLALWRFPGNGTRMVVPFITAGPAFAFKTGCTLTVDGDDHECNENTTAVSGSELGFIVGGGVEIGRLRASLRLDRGLSNINGDGPAVVKNHAVTLAVGYGFRIGG